MECLWLGVYVMTCKAQWFPYVRTWYCTTYLCTKQALSTDTTTMAGAIQYVNSGSQRILKRKCLYILWKKSACQCFTLECVCLSVKKLAHLKCMTNFLWQLTTVKNTHILS